MPKSDGHVEMAGEEGTTVQMECLGEEAGEEEEKDEDY